MIRATVAGPGEYAAIVTRDYDASAKRRRLGERKADLEPEHEDGKERSRS